MGIPSNLLSYAENYLLPINFLPIFILMLFLNIGVLLASGRAILAGFMSTMIYVLSLAFTPIVIYALKLNMNYIGCAFAGGLMTISVILFILFVSNCFKFIRPRWKAFFKTPSKYFRTLMGLNFQAWIQQLWALYLLLSLQCWSKKVSTDEKTIAKICTIYSTTMKIMSYLNLCVSTGIGGLISSATYVLCKNDKKRFKAIILWILLIPISITVIISSIMIIDPYLILHLWIKEKDSYIRKISPIPYYSAM